VHPEPRFAADLYQGTAEFYDRFRPAYPPVLTDDLIARVRPSRAARLLDLACGTGQLAFALADSFAEVWAVDQEPDMVRIVREKEHPTVRAIASSAEQLSADPGSFDLITIGNAFQRLPRDEVARSALAWLRPGGHLALCWSDAPWTGDADWQRTLRSILDRWRGEVGALLPDGWAAARATRPDLVVLSDAGFEPRGRQEFSIERRWTVPELAGFVYSTSFLPARVFGDRAPAFEADLADHLHGALVDRVSFAYDLFRRPVTAGATRSSGR
jgi:SAM-dependent methyltransferase